jgi:putative DNA primase/helicase
MAKKAKKAKARVSKAETNVSPPISVIAEGKDEWGRRYFRLGESGEPIPNLQPVLASRLINKKQEVFGELVNAGYGLFTSPTQNSFLKSVQQWGQKGSTFRVATRIGWNGRTYVLPDKIFNPKRNVHALLEELKPDAIAKYRVSKKDSLQDWQQKIGKLCVNNSRLMFAVSLAFTGPILLFVEGGRSGGFQIYGDAETGKSTAAMVAGSVWGCHLQPDNGFIEAWNTTAKAVEPTVLAHNDGLLILDETKNAGSTPRERAKVVMDVTMRLAEQKERQRLTNAKAPRSWRCYFLSTSNDSLAELATKGSLEIDDAVRGRLVDIPLPNTPHGIYEDLHGVPNGRRLTDHLKSQCRIYYGVPIREFLSRLLATLQQNKVEQIKTGIKKARQRYLNDLTHDLKKRPTLVRPLQRASGRFATVYAAGALAISLGVLDWDRTQLRKAILSCQLDGLTKPITTEDSVILALDKKMADYMRQNKAKSMDLRRRYADPKTHRFGSVPYYIAIHKGYMYCYLTDKALKLIIGTEDDARRYKQRLADIKRLDVSSGGRQGRRFVVERRIFTGTGKQGIKWVHAIKLKPVKTSA